MIDHHNGVIEMAKTETNKGKDVPSKGSGSIHCNESASRDYGDGEAPRRGAIDVLGYTAL